MGRFEEFRRKLTPGKVYRRADFARWSNAVDHHIRQALKAGHLSKVRSGLYFAPKETVFGKAPPSDAELVSAFLNGGDFLVTSPNAWNALGVGLTQVQNRVVVYNRKRHGDVVLAGRVFAFRRKANFPKTASPEFLLVDLVNNLEQAGEDPSEVLKLVREKAASCDRTKLSHALAMYGSARAKRAFGTLVSEP